MTDETRDPAASLGSGLFEFDDARPTVRAFVRFDREIATLDSRDLGDICIDRETAVELAVRLMAWVCREQIPQGQIDEFMDGLRGVVLNENPTADSMKR